MIFWMVNHCNALDLLAYRRPGDHLIDIKVGQRLLGCLSRHNLGLNGNCRAKRWWLWL